MSRSAWLGWPSPLMKLKVQRMLEGKATCSPNYYSTWKINHQSVKGLNDLRPPHRLSHHLPLTDLLTTELGPPDLSLQGEGVGPFREQLSVVAPPEVGGMLGRPLALQIAHHLLFHASDDPFLAGVFLMKKNPH